MVVVLIGPDDEVYRRLAPDTVDHENECVLRNAFYTNGGPDPEISVHLRRLVDSVDAILIKVNRPHFGMGMLKVFEDSTQAAIGC